MNNQELTPEEMAALGLSRDLANAIVALPMQPLSGNDTVDAYYHLRAIQSIILSRAGVRANLSKLDTVFI